MPSSSCINEMPGPDVNFRTDYQESPASVRFVNRSPLPGEEAAYRAEWRRVGYCRIAFLRKPP